MLNGEGKDTVSSSSLSPKDDGAANTSQTEATVSSPMKMNVNEAGVTPESTDKKENVSKEVINEEDEIAGVNNGKIAVDKEKDEETVKEKEENTMEKHEKNESNALEEDGEENEMEEEDDDGEGGEEEEEEEEYDIEEEEVEEDGVGEEDDDEGEEQEEDEGEEEKDADKEQQEDKKEENQDKSIEQAKNEEDVGPNSKKKRLRKQDRKKKLAQKGSETVAAKMEDKPGPSGKKKVSKRSESMGMIFMCSSKTKKDCYRYKVLGLPASKRDIVQKIYKGMRLFLYDFDVRLMYGIYKAAGPGGYNIEPKAFKSAFPSQVRFTVLDDCLPLPEEKFKKVIKDNYYTKNKFDCQLNSEQVKNLCKLFVAASRLSKSKKLGRNSRAETDKFKDRDRVRRRNMDEERPSSSGVKRRYRDRPYERERYGSRAALLTRLPPPAPEPYSSYGRRLEMDVYRRDRLVQGRDHRVSDLDLRLRDEIGSRDPYISYREPPPYRDPLYSPGDRLYSTGLRPEYNPPAGLLVEYRRPASPSEYGPLRPLYRY